MSSQQTPSNSHGANDSTTRGATDVVDEHGHGHSVAAWAGVAVCLAGFLILCLAIVFPSLTWGIIGGVVIVASLAVAGGLAKAGYGVKKADGTPVGVGRAQH
ncbi:HGxxPAAW family protein [Kineococcus sp. GCM10028916]|uniref:HGxxPAAW family protein n=1 Tax=Kineococcus sp. GCM10028916 TaxID=3273394 RepID=UPI00363D89B8